MLRMLGMWLNYLKTLTLYKITKMFVRSELLPILITTNATLVTFVVFVPSLTSNTCWSYGIQSWTVYMSLGSSNSIALNIPQSWERSSNRAWKQTVQCQHIGLLLSFQIIKTVYIRCGKWVKQHVMYIIMWHDHRVTRRILHASFLVS